MNEVNNATMKWTIQKETDIVGLSRDSISIKKIVHVSSYIFVGHRYWSYYLYFSAMSYHFSANYFHPTIYIDFVNITESNFILHLLLNKIIIKKNYTVQIIYLCGIFKLLL